MEDYIRSYYKDIISDPDLPKFHRAAVNGNRNLLLLLMPQNVNKEYEGRTALHMAVYTGMGETVKTLLKHGAQVDARDPWGYTPLHWAGNAVVVQLLLDHGADIKANDIWHKQTPLHLAWNTAVVQLLLDHGADVNTRDRYQKTPLHLVSNPAVVQLLVDRGADTKARDKDNHTPMQEAVYYDRLESASAMITLTASPQQKFVTKLVTRAGVTPDKQVKEDILMTCADILSDPELNLEDDTVLDWSDHDLADSTFKERLDQLPNDGRYHALFIYNNKVSTLPNLLSYTQLQSLWYLAISENPIHIIQGLPSNLKGLYCRHTEIEVLGKACFHINCIDMLRHSLKSANQYDTLKQPPSEVFERGLDDILRYFTKELMSNSQYRVVAIGDTGAGKSSCIESVILGKPYLTHETDRTHVLDMKHWHVSGEDLFTFFDQGGHEVYDITNPYFIAIKSMVLIFQDLCKTENIPRTLDILRRTLHHHPQNAIHFVLTHIDQVDQVKQSVLSFEKEIQELLQGEISTFKRLLSSPKNKGYIEEKNVQALLEHCQEKQSTIKYFPISSKTYEGIEELKLFLKSTILKQRVNIPSLWVDCLQKMVESKLSFWTISKLLEVINVSQSSCNTSQSGTGSHVSQLASHISQSGSQVSHKTETSKVSFWTRTKKVLKHIKGSKSGDSSSDSHHKVDKKNKGSFWAKSTKFLKFRSDSGTGDKREVSLGSDHTKEKVPSCSDHNKMEVTSGIDHVIEEVASANAHNSEVLDCLRYLNDRGMVIWLEDHDTLKDYVFHDIEFLIEVLKALFHHDLKSTIQYENDLDLQSIFTETEFIDTLKKYQEEGVLKFTFLQYLWKKYDLHENDELAIIALIRQFHLFSEIPSHQDKEFFVPWFVKKNKIPPNFNVSDPIVINSKDVSLNMECLFYNRLPLNVTEHFLVEVQGYVFEQGYLGSRYAWADGLQVQIDKTTITAFRNVEQATLSLLITAEYDYLPEMWDSLKRLNESLKSILRSYHGALRSHHSNCFHCKKVGISPVHRWLQEKVLPLRPFKDLYMRCDNDKTKEVPAGLVTRMPNDDKLQQRLHTVMTYLQTGEVNHDRSMEITKPEDLNNLLKQFADLTAQLSQQAQWSFEHQSNSSLDNEMYSEQLYHQSSQLQSQNLSQGGTHTQQNPAQSKTFAPSVAESQQMYHCKKEQERELANVMRLEVRDDSGLELHSSLKKHKQDLHQRMQVDSELLNNMLFSDLIQIEEKERIEADSNRSTFILKLLDGHDSKKEKKFVESLCNCKSDSENYKLGELIQHDWETKLSNTPLQTSFAEPSTPPEAFSTPLKEPSTSSQVNPVYNVTPESWQVVPVKVGSSAMQVPTSAEMDQQVQFLSHQINVQGRNISQQMISLQQAISDHVTEKADQVTSIVTEKADQVTTTVTEKADQVATTVTEKAEQVTTTVTEKADQVATTVTEKAEQVTTTVTEKAEQVTTTVTEKADQVATTVTEKAEQVTTTVTEKADQVATTVTEKAEQVTTTVTEKAEQVATTVTEKAEQVATTVTEKAEQVATTVTEKAEQVATTVTEKAEQVATTVTEKAEQVATTVTEKADQVATTVTEKADQVATTVTEKAEQVATTVTEKAEQVATTVTEKAEQVTTTVTEKADQVATTVTEKADQVATTVTEKAEQVATTVTEKADQVATTVTEKADQLTCNIKLEAGSAASVEVSYTNHILKQNQSTLENFLDVNEDLLYRLYCSGVVTTDEKQVIENDKQELGKTKRLLMIVDKCEEKMPGSVISFMQVLETCNESTSNYYLGTELKKYS